MIERSLGEPLLPAARHLRIVIQCRQRSDVATCEHLAFAFARDAGLRELAVWSAAACAASLAAHLVARGSGELELRVVGAPRPALELHAAGEGEPLDEFPAELRAARDHASELRVAWHASSGSFVTARFWL